MLCDEIQDENVVFLLTKRERDKRYYIDNHDEIRRKQNEYNKVWYAKNKDKINAQRRKKYRKGERMPMEERRKKNANDAMSRNLDQEFARQWHVKQQKKINERVIIDRKEAHRLLGGRCVRCGFSDWRALAIDHINGGGNIERREKHRSGTKMYRHIIKNGTAGYQLLCFNCNEIKRMERREFGNMKFPETQPKEQRGE